MRYNIEELQNEAVPRSYKKCIDNLLITSKQNNEDINTKQKRTEPTIKDVMEQNIPKKSNRKIDIMDKRSIPRKNKKKKLFKTKMLTIGGRRGQVGVSKSKKKE